MSMRVAVFGASGMVGHGVLDACLNDPRVGDILVVGRTPLNLRHPKVREVVHTVFTDFRAIQGEFEGLDGCFFCLGVSAAGRSEAEYTRITYDYTPAAARAVSAHNPSLTFTYVSGEGTDSTEAGRSMWARVKGRTENALLAMPFHAYLFRPGYIRPQRGAVSRTAAYRRLYRLTSWLYPLLHRLAPGHTTTTEHLGRAMIAVVGLDGRGPHVLHSPDINRLGTPASTGAAPER
ncbi:epimerase [Streptomyces sp. AK02-04a]|uniref:epimerase n=1 Tax=Streptomyces sp. AK02-04a TaxID=3028649 RepID=UPI0029BB9DC2|nr:epimerase [Streptomyces sp. AK02-04a]MDX3762410.1 epimerase [Streptomyces sp. AK02-04a]